MRRDRCQSVGPGDNGVTQPALGGNLSSRLYRCQTFELSGSLGITMVLRPEMCRLHYMRLIYGFLDNLFNAWMEFFVFMWHLPLLSHGLCMKLLTPLDTEQSALCSSVLQSRCIHMNLYHWVSFKQYRWWFDIFSNVVWLSGRCRGHSRQSSGWTISWISIIWHHKLILNSNYSND